MLQNVQIKKYTNLHQPTVNPCTNINGKATIAALIDEMYRFGKAPNIPISKKKWREGVH